MTSSGHSDAGTGDFAPTDGKKPRFHGRRQGRPLRKGRARLIETLLPAIGIDLPSRGKLDLAELFGSAKGRYWLEIGFGAGEHLAWQAAEHPHNGIIGCEVFINGVASLLRHVEEQSLTNVRVYNDDAHALLNALPDQSIDRLFLLHPDPWPKYRHTARRIVQVGTVRRFAQLMPVDAELRIATDHSIYLGWVLRIMGSQPWFEWRAETAGGWLYRPDDWPQTRYAAKAIREGRQCTYLRYRRNSQSAD